MEKHFVTVANIADLAPGASQSVELRDVGLALFNIDGTIYALDNTCPHAGGPLGEGTLEGTLVSCPWHGWKFDVTNGTCMKNRSESWAVPCYEVRETDGQIQVLLPVSSKPESSTKSHQNEEEERAHGAA